jgi:hypothetical protein
MLIGGIVAGLVTGLLAGGHLANLAAVRLRWIGVLFLAVVIRFATEWALNAGIPFAETFRLPLFAASFGLLLGRPLGQPPPARPEPRVHRHPPERDRRRRERRPHADLAGRASSPPASIRTRSSRSST